MVLKAVSAGLIEPAVESQWIPWTSYYNMPPPQNSAPSPNNQVVNRSCFPLVPFYCPRNTDGSFFFFHPVCSGSAPIPLFMYRRVFSPWFKAEPSNIKRTICLSFGFLLNDMLKDEHCFKLWVLDSTGNISPCTHFVLRCMWIMCMPWKGYRKEWNYEQMGTLHVPRKLFVDSLYKQPEGES